VYILGINAYHGDSAACLVADGKLVAAIEEERIRRIKHWAGFPSEAIRFCLDHAGLKLSEIDHIAIGRNPSAHLHKKILFSLQRRPSFGAIKDRLANMGKVRDLRKILGDELGEDSATIRADLHNIEHHRAHMASSYYLSPFDQAACLTIDGFGDFVSTMFGMGRGNDLDADQWVQFPHSMGLFYTACTQYVERIVGGDVVGWFQGRSEWGPRALGNRSIIVDPRRKEMKDVLNARIKRREEFRPFAPSILEERSGDYFEESYPVPYMLQVYKIRPERRDEIPAVTHVDGTGRLQTVSRDENPLYHRLIHTFGQKTGTPIVLNTSFNENEPMVNRPQEAIDCFLRTRMDTLVVGKAFLRKQS